MTTRDYISEDLVVTDFAGMFAAIAAGIRQLHAEAHPDVPFPPDWEQQRALDADAITAKAMEALNEEIEQCQRDNPYDWD